MRKKGEFKQHMDKEKLIETLKEENDSRWIGKPHYDCLSCSHSMSTENNELICVVDENNHHKVDDEHLCESWT